jgi:uncharacterized protein (TIGR03437 family)
MVTVPPMSRRFLRSIRLLSVSICYMLLLGSSQAEAAGSSTVVISQVYGGGGNQGATLTHDFIELLNRGGSPVDVSGWTVQYASASGGSWKRTPLSGSIQPGQYYLVQEKQGSGGTTALPTPDAFGGLALSASSGKVALVSNSSLLSGTSPSGSHVVDFAGYGTANHSEHHPAGKLDNTRAAIRKSGGCIDTDNNSADFDVLAPNPRNSQSPLNLCTVPVTPGPEISAAGVTNAATFLAGSVAPGEIITIFGSRLGPSTLATLQLTADRQYVTTSLAGTRVLFDNIPAPMIYTSAGQVSVVVPYRVSGRSSTTLQVEYNAKKSNSVSLGVRQCVPGIFTLDSSGKHQAAALNQDYSVNGPGRPAEKGSIVILYATGGGQTSPSGVDGKVLGADLPALIAPVSVRMGGVEADVLYAGPAPGMVSGVIQINAKVPEGLASSGAVGVEIVVGNDRSPPGVTLSIEGTQPPTGGWQGSEAVEQKYSQLKNNATVPSLPEIPHDQIGLPADWLGIISWNIQVGGTSTTSGAERPSMVQAALQRMFSGTYGILAAQEIPNANSAQLLTTLLPGGTTQWAGTFFDTNDSMDNGFWHRGGVTLRDAFPLFVTNTIVNGRITKDPDKAAHPPVVAQYEVGNFDFTLITLHLTYASGDTSKSVAELGHVLDYLDWYFVQPDHDPDVLICGDFNIPSMLSGQTAQNGITLDPVFGRDPRFQSGERRFVVTVHQPTSRRSASNGGTPANNYDHCVCSVDTLEELIQGRRVSPDVLTAHPNDPEVRLTSDHFPTVVFFKTTGDGIQLDNSTRIRP